MIKIKYTVYEGSRRASNLEDCSAICKAFCVAIVATMVPNRDSFSSTALFIDLGIAAILLVSAILLSNAAAKIGPQDFQRKITSDLDFGIEMCRKHPENQETYMSLNPELNAYILSGNLENTPVKRAVITGLAVFFGLLILCLGVPAACVLIHNHNSRVPDKIATYSDATKDLKKDMEKLKKVYCYEFGYSKDAVQVRDNIADYPANVPYFNAVSNLMDNPTEDPILNIDDEALAFLRLTESIYTQIDEITDFYNSGLYINDPETGLSMHQALLDTFDIWETEADLFSEALTTAEEAK